MSTLPTISVSKIVGYLNPHNYEVIINISAVNLNQRVGSKCYVLNREGQKVNDPLLEQFVGPDMLVRETSKEPVPPMLFPRPQVVISGAHYSGVASSSTVVKDARGIVQNSSFDGIIAQSTGNPAPSVTGAAMSTSSIRVYTVKEAVALKIIRPVLMPDDSRAPVETAGEPGRLDNVPPILMARDASPSEAKRMIAEGIVRADVPITDINRRPEPPIVKLDEHEVVDDDVGVVDVAAEMRRLAEMPLDPVAEAPRQTPLPDIPIPALTVVEAVAPPLPMLLKPNVKPTGVVNRPDPFVCSADGRSFKRKGNLINHIKANFPIRFEELMRPYEAVGEDENQAVEPTGR